MAGERHGRGMLCVNRPLRAFGDQALLSVYNGYFQRLLRLSGSHFLWHYKDQYTVYNVTAFFTPYVSSSLSVLWKPPPPPQWARDILQTFTAVRFSFPPFNKRIAVTTFPCFFSSFSSSFSSLSFSSSFGRRFKVYPSFTILYHTPIFTSKIDNIYDVTQRYNKNLIRELAQLQVFTIYSLHNYRCSRYTACTDTAVHDIQLAQLQVFTIYSLHSYRCSRYTACTATGVHDIQLAQLQL
jgi:hypothetical protein